MIAVNQIATASNLDITLSPGSARRDARAPRLRKRQSRLNLQRSRLVGYRTVERKIGLRIGLLGHFDLRGLRAVLLVPGFDLVFARRQSLDRECSARVADREERMREHRDVSFHPGMLVAFN